MVEEIFEIQMSNPDHQETLTFPNLKDVEVSACPSLKSIFPAAPVAINISNNVRFSI